MGIRGRRQPDFENLALILEKKRPKRPTPFEFMIDEPHLRRLAGSRFRKGGMKEHLTSTIYAFANGGFDYAMVHASQFHFRVGERHRAQSISQNEGALITDRESFDRYIWNDPRDFSLEPLEEAARELPEGMKLIICCPCGVLENVVAIVGYENLCYMAYEDEALVEDIFEQVGSRLVTYCRDALRYDFVGAIMSNDDWGFNTQTMLPPEMMRRYVFPFHKEIVSAAHAAGKYAMLHSCGNYSLIIEDVIEDMKFDGRHSYEDVIEPVETAYERLKGRLAVLGGIDMDYLARSSPEEIAQRSRKMLERAQDAGGYALGSGNSIAEYVPFEHFLAMLQVALNG